MCMKKVTVSIGVVLILLALFSCTDNYQAHQSLAIAYTKKGWYDYALKEAETALDLYPADENYKLIQGYKAKAKPGCNRGAGIRVTKIRRLQTYLIPL